MLKVPIAIRYEEFQRACRQMSNGGAFDDTWLRRVSGDKETKGRVIEWRTYGIKRSGYQVFLAELEEQVDNAKNTSIKNPVYKLHYLI